MRTAVHVVCRVEDGQESVRDGAGEAEEAEGREEPDLVTHTESQHGYHRDDNPCNAAPPTRGVCVCVCVWGGGSGSLL